MCLENSACPRSRNELRQAQSQVRSLAQEQGPVEAAWETAKGALLWHVWDHLLPLQERIRQRLRLPER